MMTLRQFSANPPTVPKATAWMVGNLGISLGKQQLFTFQSPQRLKVLREHALIESAVSSNRIEGIEVDQKRVAGSEVGSLERLIEQNKDRYYEALEQSSQAWHEGTHNPWSFINFVLWILKDAYKEFEQRVGETAEPFGAKAQLVRQAIARQQSSFSIADIERACPGVGRDWIRSILRKMKAESQLRSFGHGAGARWERL